MPKVVDRERRHSSSVVALIVGTATQLLVRPRSGEPQLANAVESYVREIGPRL